MPLVATINTGGSGITSYNLQYDQGGTPGANTAGPAQESDFVSLIGEIPDTNAATRVFVLGGLTTNTIYTFRY